MPRRKEIFANNYYYHVFNRGVAGISIFENRTDYKRLIKLFDYYRFYDVPLSYSAFYKLSTEEQKSVYNKMLKKQNPLVEILAFCLMPNHYHLLLKQLVTDGIKDYVTVIQNSYSKYFNIKYERNGPLWQSRYKAVRIDSDEQLTHVSRYIHLNPVTSYLIEKDEMTNYEWSSYPVYLGINNSAFVSIEMILKMLGGRDKHERFVQDNSDYQRDLKRIKRLTFD